MCNVLFQVKHMIISKIQKSNNAPPTQVSFPQCAPIKHSSHGNFLLAGLFAIRSDREYVTQEDFMKAVRKVADSKKLESKLDYKPV